MPTNKGQNVPSNPALWAAIGRAPLPGIVRPKLLFRREKELSFQERLERRYNLTETSARRLEEEYRRYLYLKTIDGGLLTPSKRVDDAWHLHMETPGGAWSRYCDEVLGKRLVHRTGLPRRAAMAAYDRLISMYQEEFDSPPPEDIWPGPRQRRRRAWADAVFLLGIGVFGLSFVVGESAAVDDSLAAVLAFAGLAFACGGHWIASRGDLETVASCG